MSGSARRRSTRILTGPWPRWTWAACRWSVVLDMTPEARLGDYVLVHAGYAISVLDEAEAHETLRLLEECMPTEELPQTQEHKR